MIATLKAPLAVSPGQRADAQRLISPFYLIPLYSRECFCDALGKVILHAPYWRECAIGNETCRYESLFQCERLQKLVLRPYVRLPSLLQQFMQARAQGTYAQLLKRLGKLLLLLIDDIGLSSITEAQTQDLLETLEERYGTGSTITTSQLPVSHWHEYLGGGRIADAILDRLIHNAHRIELSARESMRKTAASLPHGGQSGK